MTFTPTEEIVPLMRKLTLFQQMELVKKARELGKQNRSKSQPSEKKTKVSAVKAAKGRIPQKAGFSSATPAVSKAPMEPDEAVVVCPKCKRGMDAKELAQHLKAKHNLVMCLACHALVVDGVAFTKHLMGHFPSAEEQRTSARSLKSGRRGGYTGNWDDAPRVFQGGLCGKK